MGQQNAKSPLSIRIITAKTQSLELFDYHHGITDFQQKTIKSPSFIVTDGQTLKLINNQNQYLHNELLPFLTLFKITLDDFQQIRIQNHTNQPDKTLWKVIKNGQMYPIKVGETLKIGKIKIKLKKIVGQKSQRATQEFTDKQEAQSPLKDDVKSVNSNLSETNRCRICFGHSNEKSDPLICLCKCSGSIKFTHFSCLKDWIVNSITKREQQKYKFYSYNDIVCQLCKSMIPLNFYHEGKQYSFISMDFQPPYAEFGSDQIEQDGKRKHHKYIIKLEENKEISLGRNNSNQVMIKDISVSRTHCSLQYKHGSLIVRDKKSKFGTLVKVEKSLQFNLQHGLQLQFDSSVIELFRKHRLKGCCCSDIDNFRLVYELLGKENFQSEKSQKNKMRNQQFSSQSYEQIELEYSPNDRENGTANQLLATRENLQTNRQTMHRNTESQLGATRY